MQKTKVTTLHIRDAVSKTFHISDEEIILHTDMGGEQFVVPEEYRDQLLAMIQVGDNLADEITEMKEINVHGEASPMLGESAQRIWEDMIDNK